MKTKRSERRKHCARAGCSKIRTPPARPPATNTHRHRQDRLQYTAPLASAQCNKTSSRHRGQCIPVGSSVSLPTAELITISIITIRIVFGAKSVSDWLLFAKFRLKFCESCGATYRRNCEMFSALQLQSTN